MPNNDETLLEQYPEWADPITIREGWLDYAYEPDPEPPRPVTASSYSKMTAAQQAAWNEQRRNWHANFGVIHTPVLTAALDLLDIVHDNNVRHRHAPSRRGAGVDGPPTSGKSTTMYAIARIKQRELQPVRPPDQMTEPFLPVVCVTMPASAQARTLGLAIARAINHPLSHVTKGGTGVEFLYRVLDVLNAWGTRYLFIDEAHNLWPTTTEGRKATYVVKEVLNRFRGTVFVAGVDLGSTGMLSGKAAAAISGRMLIEPNPPFTLATTTETARWRALIGGFESDIRLLHHKPGLLTDTLYEELWELTGGYVGALKYLLSDACKKAVDLGPPPAKKTPGVIYGEAITLELLKTIRISHFTQTLQQQRRATVGTTRKPATKKPATKKAAAKKAAAKRPAA